MPELFEETRIKSLVLPNRVVRSATHEGLADESGGPSERLFRLYRRLARGEVGLIITGYAYVCPDGEGPFPGMLAIDRDELIPAYRRLVDHVHGEGAPVAMQIAHCGRQTHEASTGQATIAPSPVKNGLLADRPPREMSDDDIERVIEAFGQAARRVREAGFDAVQLHGAHGYLINQFLCPRTNRRRDRWGGSFENRMRFVERVYARCRELVGDDYPVLIKINAYDRVRNGLRLPETVRTAARLGELGFDGVEISCGINEGGMTTLRGDVPIDVFLSEWPEFRRKGPLFRLFVRLFGRWLFRPPPMREAFNLPAARAMREVCSAPLFLVGGITDPAAMEELVASGEVDYVCLSRALLAEPRFPKLVREGRREPSACLHCNLCMGYLASAPLRCYRGKRPRVAPDRQLTAGSSSST